MTLKELYAQHTGDDRKRVEKPKRPVVVTKTVPVSQISVSPTQRSLLLPSTRVLCGYVTASEDESTVTITAEGVKSKSSITIEIKEKNGLTKVDTDFINKLIPCAVSITSDNDCLMTLQLCIGEVDVTVTENKSDALPDKGNES